MARISSGSRRGEREPMAQLHVPDVSEFQSDVTWPKVKARNGGAAIIRVSYGTGHEDILWSQGRRASAEAAGMRALGFYHYLVAGQDALAQAQVFVRLVGSLKPGQFAVLDLEEGSGDQSGRANTFLGYCDKHLTYAGYQGAWLYSGASFAAAQGLGPIFASKRHTWVAAYPNSYPSAEPGLPHSLWQHTNGSIGKCSNQPWPGIGFCDCSQFDGSLDDFLARIHSGSAPAPDPQPDPSVPVPASPQVVTTGGNQGLRSFAHYHSMTPQSVIWLTARQKDGGFGTEQGAYISGGQFDDNMPPGSTWWIGPTP